MSIEEAEKPQHMHALDHANVVRLERAALKKQIKEGRKTVREVLIKTPKCVWNVTLYDFFQWQHNWGHDKTVRVLSQHLLSQSKTIRNLSERQRKALIEEFTPWTT